MKLLQTLAVAALLAPLVISAPTTTASTACDQAVIAFREAFVAADLQYTQSNAELLADAVEACGNLPPADSDPFFSETMATANATLVAAGATVRTKLPARDCGATSVPPLNVDAAKIIAVTSITIPSVGPLGPYLKMETEWGPATATYDPDSDLTTYTVRGTTGENGNSSKWGLDASSAGNVAANLPQGTQGHGIIYLHGVPIPAVYLNGYGKAKAGCTEDTLGTVCWAEGEAKVYLTTMVMIQIYSKFTKC